MRIRNDHHVAGSIRIAVKDDKGFRPAKDHQRFGVVLPRRGITKNTVRLYAARRIFHVLETPGSPEVIHQLALLRKVAAPAYSAQLPASKWQPAECGQFQGR